MNRLLIGALLIYVVASVVTFALFGLDKRAAVRGRRRVPEASLHMLELFGGVPGSLLGQHLFRHKRAKGRYQIVFWLIVLLHTAGWTAWFLQMT